MDQLRLEQAVAVAAITVVQVGLLVLVVVALGPVDQI
jgi:hypothetical protein